MWPDPLSICYVGKGLGTDVVVSKWKSQGVGGYGMFVCKLS